MVFSVFKFSAPALLLMMFLSLSLLHNTCVQYYVKEKVWFFLFLVFCARFVADHAFLCLTF